MISDIWVLVLIFSLGHGLEAEQFSMANQEICIKAAAHLATEEDIDAFCLNRQTGDAILVPRED